MIPVGTNVVILLQCDMFRPRERKWYEVCDEDSVARNLRPHICSYVHIMYKVRGYVGTHMCHYSTSE